MSVADPRQWQALQTRLLRRQIGSSPGRRAWTTGDWESASWRRDKKYQTSNTVRSLMPQIVWFDGAIQAYMAPILAKAMGDTGALLMTIARRSVRPHRKKRLAELTPYEREYYDSRMLTKTDDSSLIHFGMSASMIRTWNKSLLPNKPGDPGGPARYTDNGTLNFRSSILFGYDPATRSVVCGPVMLAGAGAKRRQIPKLLEEGGQVEVSYGINAGRMTYLAARPTMRLALAAGLPRIECIFKLDGQVSASIDGRNAQVSIS